MGRRFLGLCAVGMEVLAFGPKLVRAENVTTSAQAWDLGASITPRSLALAGGDLAVGASTSSAFGNPSGLLLSRAYEVEAMATWAPEAGFSQYGAAIADSMTSKIAGAFAGQRTDFTTARLARTAIDLRASMAVPFGDSLSLGVAGRWLRTEDRPGSGATAGEAVANSGAQRTRMAFDVGLVIHPVPAFRLGFVARNLFATPSFDLPRILAGGVGVTLDALTVESTALVDLTVPEVPRWRSSTGLEWSASERYAVRFGYRFDEGHRTHSIGFGVAIFDRAGALETSVRRDIAGPWPATFVTLGLRALMNSPGQGDGTSSGSM